MESELAVSLWLRWEVYGHLIMVLDGGVCRGAAVAQLH